MNLRMRGVSLVELMIAITLGLLLLTLLLRILVDSREATTVQQALLLSEGEGAVALDLITHDLRSAGNWGCQPHLVTTDDLPVSSAWHNYSRAVEAWPAPHTPTELLPGTLELLPDSDVLAVRLASQTQWPTLAVNADTVILPLEQRENRRCNGEPRFNGLCPGDHVLISHCGGGRIATITETRTTPMNNNETLLLTLDPSPPSQQIDTRVRPVHTRVWFMAERRDGSRGLFMREDAGPSREVAHGEHRLQSRFAAPGTGFSAPAEVQDWPLISAVWLELHWYNEGGPETGRLLQSSVAIRNRLP